MHILKNPTRMNECLTKLQHKNKSAIGYQTNGTNTKQKKKRKKKRCSYELRGPTAIYRIYKYVAVTF